MEIKIEKTKTPKAKPVDETKLGFGHIFTDHMFVMEYDTGKGWHDARIVPYGDISISPAAMAVSYTHLKKGFGSGSALVNRQNIFHAENQSFPPVSYTHLSPRAKPAA